MSQLTKIESITWHDPELGDVTLTKADGPGWDVESVAGVINMESIPAVYRLLDGMGVDRHSTPTSSR